MAFASLVTKPSAGTPMPAQESLHRDGTCPAQKHADNPSTSAQVRIGVMGSAAELDDEVLRLKCRALGKAIAQSGCAVLTGACPGIPHEAVLGAKESGGFVIGISPASSLKEHVQVFTSPYEGYDVLIYTGLGLMGRELVNIRSSDIVIVAGGRCGTLGEFAIAYEEGKLIGVLSGSGGIVDILPELTDVLAKKTGSEVMFDADPCLLVSRLLSRFREESYHCDCKAS